MITAHIPSGYLLGKTLQAKHRLLMTVVIIGSVFPDFDLFWFYLVDNKAFHHHRYWVHAPGFWLLISAIIIPALSLWYKAALKPYLFFLAAVILHICLDTIAGSIMWLWPFSDQLYEMVTVPATHKHWVLSFMAHWTFRLEIAIWIIALLTVIRAR
jgi:hypothetical protein